MSTPNQKCLETLILIGNQPIYFCHLFFGSTTPPPSAPQQILIAMAELYQWTYRGVKQILDLMFANNENVILSGVILLWMYI